jgi:hypothetical protein
MLKTVYKSLIGVWGRGEVHRGFWWGNLKKGVLLGRHRRRWENNIKMDIREVGLRAWTELIWLRIGTGGGLL